MTTNTQTDTPETDAVEQHVQRDINRKWVLADFSKRLERERDAALRELAELRKDKDRLDWLLEDVITRYDIMYCDRKSIDAAKEAQ